MVSLCKYYLRDAKRCIHFCEKLDVTRKITKRTCRYSCPFCLPAFIIGLISFIIVIVFGGLPTYDSSLSTLFLKTTTFAQNNFDISDEILLSNINISMCTNPIAYVCSDGTKSIARETQIYNTKLQYQIEEESLVETNFGIQCKEFHDQSTFTQMNRIIKHSVFQLILNKLQQIRSIDDIWIIIDFFHKNGIREPFRTNHLLNGAYKLDQPRCFTGDLSQVDLFIDTIGNIPYSDKIEINQDYTTIYQQIYFSETNSRLISRDYIENNLQFPIHIYLPSEVQKMEVDDMMLQNFIRVLHSFPLRKWKNYLFVASIRSILHQMRILQKTDSSICKSQITEYFPLYICRQFKKKIQSSATLEYKYLKVIDEFKRTLLVENTFFEFSNHSATLLNKGLSEIKILFGHCATHQWNESFTLINDLFLNNNNYKNYEDRIFALISYKPWQETRFSEDEVYSRRLVENYLVWNAWFDPTQRILVIPPGILTRIANLFTIGTNIL